MEPTANPAASSFLDCPCTRLALGAHHRALTVNLMELLDCRESDAGNWAAAVGGHAATCVAFDPDRLLQTTCDFAGEEGSAGREVLHSVIVVFDDGPPRLDVKFLEAGKDTVFNGSVMRFLASRTNFVQQFGTCSAALPLSAPGFGENIGVVGDGVGAVLLFMDVRMEGPGGDDRTFSVVYVQLVENEHIAVDRAAAQRRAAQVIDTAHALFYNATGVTFWVDFTGVLDSGGSLLLREVREAWWNLAVASALASTALAPQVAVFVDDPAAISRLRGDAAVEEREETRENAEEGEEEEETKEEEKGKGEEEVSRSDAGNDVNGVDGSAFISSREHSLIPWQQKDGVKGTDRVTSSAPPALENEDGDDDDDLIWKKYAHLAQRPLQTALLEAPPALSCLFLECSSGSSLASPGCDASMRELLVAWSSFGVDHPPRTVIMISDEVNCLENALLSWVQIPWSENALIVPLFGIDELATCQDFCSTMGSSLSSSAVATQKPLTSDVSSTCGRFFRILTFAVHYFGIDVHRSACLAVTTPFQQAAALLNCQCVGDQAHVFSWVMQSHARTSATRSLLDVEAERERIFAKLCATNMLARMLRDRPRRPEVLLRVVNYMRVGIVRPVVRDAVALAPMPLIGTRVRYSADLILSLSPQERTQVYRYMISFFTKDVFCVSVDIVRSCGADYFSGHRFLTVGYMKYELSSRVRRHVLVDVHLDLQPLLKDQRMGAGRETEPHWSRVFRHLSCTCTPRRHERLLRTETGEKKCRHLAQLLYWFLRPRLARPLSLFASPSSSSSVAPRRRRLRSAVPVSSVNAVGPNTAERGGGVCVRAAGAGGA